jgi:hypothetical protein
VIVIISVFSFAQGTYYKENEMPKLWPLAAQQLKPNGVLALLSYEYDPPAKLFKMIKAGTYLLADKWWINYYIGVKR